LANYRAELPLRAFHRSNSRGTLEVFEFSARMAKSAKPGSLPIVFGRALIDPYAGWQCTRQSGDSLWPSPGSSTACVVVQPIFDMADQLNNPEPTVFPGWVLRISLLRAATGTPEGAELCGYSYPLQVVYCPSKAARSC